MKITESQFAHTIEDAFERFGWLWIHSRPAGTNKGWRTALSGEPGFPDYFAVNGTKSIVVELKADDGDLAAEQYFWLCACQAAGIDAYLWQPKDDFSSIISILMLA